MPENFTPSNGENNDGSSAFDEFLARYLQGEQVRQSRSIDLSRFLSARTQGILQNAGRFALERGQRELDALHVLQVMVQEEPAKDAVARVGADAAAIARAAEERLPARTAPASVDAAMIAPSVQRALFHAY
ncbi:MAG TPA: Clp protease N-terminal domain-containing protein, partial [Microbacterium sp.]|nr:Clp protease N-terminal domain-containing protein [Microbacterium sp.]